MCDLPLFSATCDHGWPPEPLCKQAPTKKPGCPGARQSRMCRESRWRNITAPLGNWPSGVRHINLGSAQDLLQLKVESSLASFLI